MDPQLRVEEPKHFRNASLFAVVTLLILLVILLPPAFGLGYLAGFLASELCNYFPRYLGEVWHFRALLLVFLILLSVVWVMFVRYLTPGMSGNFYYPRIIRTFVKETSGRDPSMLAQMSLSPRLRKGLRAATDSADDVGLVELGPEAFLFKGDAVSMVIPYDRIGGISRHSVGPRGFWLVRCWIRLHTDAFEDYEHVDLADASSLIKPTLDAKTKWMIDELNKRIAGTGVEP